MNEQHINDVEQVIIMKIKTAGKKKMRKLLMEMKQ